MGTRIKGFGTDIPWWNLYADAAHMVADAGRIEGQGTAAMGRNIRGGVESGLRQFQAGQTRKEQSRRFDLDRQDSRRRESMANDRANLSIAARRVKEAEDQAMSLGSALRMSPELAEDPSYMQALRAAQGEAEEWSGVRDGIESRVMGGRAPSPVGAPRSQKPP